MSKTAPRPAEADAAVPARTSGPEPRAPDALTDDDAFLDLWLRLELRESFDAVVAEPIPDDLLRLIEEDRGERERIRRGRARGRRE
ncbi:hypothetical protein GCM10009416_00840 [Craurococcus roseus]|uniref:Anti-sigma factor NepR domain-containing protein n=1 Tax=Craurococcus roseus TaxID=77585 RepID=A0ABP3PG12_9PROT